MDGSDGDEDGRCPECHDDDPEIVSIRDIRRPSGKSGPADSARPVVARRILVRCRRCGCDGFVLRRVR